MQPEVAWVLSTPMEEVGKDKDAELELATGVRNTATNHTHTHSMAGVQPLLCQPKLINTNKAITFVMTL